MTDRRRLALALPIPSSVELIVVGVVLATLVGGGAGLYLKGHADGYGAGYAKAEGVYLKLMADQAAANKAAINGANKQLLETADQLAHTEHELDAALTEIEAGSGGADAGELGLDAARMRSLNTIR